jgi:NADPH:quinone reductase-like Zn-dependent oxidoreductase
MAAWQGLFEHANLTAGQHVLIHGAAGGVGSYAVQLAHWRGAHVIGTASPVNSGFVRELGADEVIDYTRTRFEDVVHDVDVVFDTVGGDTLERSWSVLRRGGTLVSITSAIDEDKPAKYDVRGIFFIVVPSRMELMEIGQLIDSGALRPVIEAVLPLEQARQAFERGLSGHNRGKIVLRIAEQAAANA